MPLRANKTARCLAASVGLFAALGSPAQTPVSSYHQPSAAIRELLEAPALPRQLISPDRQTLATLELRRMPGIEELARPVFRLAGLRFDGSTASPQTITPLLRLKLRALLNPDAPERVIELPNGGSVFHGFAWAPDGQRFVLQRRTEQATELWIGDVASGRLRAVAGVRLNSVLMNGEPVWLNSHELLALTVPDKRAAAPVAPRAPSGPAVQESLSRVSPERTYPDLLKNSVDEAQFEHFARSQMTVIDLASGAAKDIGEPGLFSSVSGVGEGQSQYLLTERLVRPFSYSLPWDDFPRTVELRQRDGRVLRELARVPLKIGVALEGVVAGPRAFFASPNKDAAVFWIEALDGGNPNNKVAFRDRVMRLDAPFNADPVEVQRMPHRFARLAFLDDGQNALLTEVDRQRAWTRTYLLPLNGSQSRPLFEHSLRERYHFPGTPLTRVLPNNGRSVVIADRGELLLAGPGASPKGERPFLDRLALKDLTTTRLFQSGETEYEQPLALLAGNRLVTVKESVNEPPNLFLRDAGNANGNTNGIALTKARDPTPQLRKIRRELVSFKRADGVELSFWLYLPPDYKDGEKRPALVWAYPLEFTDSSTAGQVNGSANRFASFPPLSPLNLVMDGFIVLSDATMPIVGDPKTVNDSFVEQITMNARAIIDKADELGVIDTRRMAVGGHSYGAFMTVNLLAHTDLFKAGIARSGAYNRTLTPFGFQAERRSLWEARDVYLKLSPFLYAPQIKEPLLLTHGEADNNSGTFPIQTERLYQALAGNGGTVRYVSLPYESHGYTARESVGHVQWEMSNWLKTYLGDPRQP
ncbi:S9 family peptidase [soil metagenome]